MPNFFTLEEANSLVVILNPVVGRLIELREQIMEKQPEAWPVIEKAAGNGGNKTTSLLAMEFQELNQLVKEIQSSGAELKDISLGLLDFRSIRDGREIYLCWKYGEEQIEFWHELETGFAGRKPI